MAIKASNMKWGAAIAGLILVLMVGVVGLKQEQAASLVSSEDEATQARDSASKDQAGSSRQHRSDSPTRWVKSEEALKHRAAAKLALEKKLKQNRPAVSASREKPVPVVKKPMRTIYPGAFYAHAPTPPGLEGFGQWVARPIPEAEILEKRQRLARGERLFKRVTIQRKEGPLNEAVGGMREIQLPIKH